MCGIAGWANLENIPLQNNSKAVLHQMCERMKHRGPDSEGLWLDDGIVLGMRRLSIIDLHTGEQPVYSEDKQIVVVMNGEIYNFKELRAKLEKLGHKFVTQTDTEVLPHLYEEYGEDLVEHLNGMFAFALWDKRRKKLLIARDRFGEKPLWEKSAVPAAILTCFMSLGLEAGAAKTSTSVTTKLPFVGNPGPPNGRARNLSARGFAKVDLNRCRFPVRATNS